MGTRLRGVDISRCVLERAECCLFRAARAAYRVAGDALLSLRRLVHVRAIHSAFFLASAPLSNRSTHVAHCGSTDACSHISLRGAQVLATVAAGAGSWAGCR